MLVSPDREAASPVLQHVLQARTPHDLEALTHQYHIDFTAPTDDRPFFFNQLVSDRSGVDQQRAGWRRMA